MTKVKLENADKGLCVACDKHITKGRMTCSENCHEEFVKFCEEQYGATKKVVDNTTGISYNVPTRDIVEKGLKWEDLHNYPRCENGE